MQSTTPSTPPQKQDLIKMQQPSQVYGPSGNSNTSGNVRQQQQQIFRGTATANVPRNHQRHNSSIMQQQMYTQQMPPVIMQCHQPTFAQRTLQFQPQQYPPHFSQFQLPAAYNGQLPIYFQNATSLIQTTSVSGIPNTGGGGQHRGVPNSIVQTGGPTMLTGPTGPPAQNQILAAGNVLTQGTANTGGPTQVSVTGVQVAGPNATMVGSVVTGPGQPPAGSGIVGHNASSRRKQLRHAIPIIDPATNKNVLDDYINPKTQSTTNNEIEYATQDNTQLANNSGIVNSVGELDNNSIMTEFVDQTKNIQAVNYPDIPPKMPDMSETPIVSAKSIAPSVDIHLQQKPQKRKNKQIEIVAPPQQQSSETVVKISSDENNRSGNNINNNLNQKVVTPSLNSADQIQIKTDQDFVKVTTTFTQQQQPQTDIGIINQPQFNTPSASSLISASIPVPANNINAPTQQILPIPPVQIQHQSAPVVPVSQIQSQQHQQYQQKENNNKVSANHPTTGKFVGTNTGLSNTLPTQKQQSSSRQQQQQQQCQQQANRNTDSNKQQINRSNNSSNNNQNNNTFTTDSLNSSTIGGNVTSNSAAQHHGASSVTTQTITKTQLEHSTTTTNPESKSSNINNTSKNNNKNNNNPLVIQSTPEQQQQHYKPVSDTKLSTSSVGVSTVNMASSVAQPITSSSSSTASVIKDNINTSSNSISKLSSISKDETDRSVKLDNVDIINNNNNKNNNNVISNKTNNNSNINSNNNSNNNNNSYANHSTITGTTAIASSKSSINEKVNENIATTKPHNELPSKVGAASGAVLSETNNLNNLTNAPSSNSLTNNNNINNNKRNPNSNSKKLECDNISNSTSITSQTESMVTSPKIESDLTTVTSNLKPDTDTMYSGKTNVNEKKASPATNIVENVNSPSETTTSKSESTCTPATSATPSSDASTPVSIISYNDGQWSPQNREGNKVYNRDQLLSLKVAPLSNVQPQFTSEVARMLLPKSLGVAPSPQPNLLPPFARPSNNKRYQSMGNPMTSGSSASNSLLKNHSTSIVNPKNNAKGSKSGMIQISLSLREDVKLNETENAWRPSHLLGESMTLEERNREELKRKIRGILNKLTPERFDPLVDQILSLQIDTTDKVNEVIYLVFEKAIDEPNFSVSYAKLCVRLVKEVNLKDDKNPSSKNLIFRSVLLDRTEREFIENVTNQESKERRLRPIMEKLKECQDPEKKLELQAQLEEEERKIRRRSGGTVRFIGELFKLSMLTGNIMKSCITHLLDAQSEDKLECLCKLLTTVGENYESTPDVKVKNKNLSLESVIKDMQNIVDRKDGAKVSSRIRFMLQDVIDLRKNHWVTSKTDIPKTMDQIQREVKTEQMSNQYMSYGNSLLSSGNSGNSGNNNSNNKKDNDSGGRRGGNSFGMNSSSGYGSNSGSSMSYGNNSGGGNRIGNNDYFNKNRNNNQQQDNDAWFTQTSKGKAVDANKLGQMSNLNYDMMDNGATKLGASSQFIWNQPKPPTTSNSFAVLSSLDSNKNSNSGPRNKGSFSKSSMERDRYGSTHGSRESSSSRNQSSNRNDMNDRLRGDRDRDGDRVRDRNDRSSGLAMKKTSSQQNYSLPNTSVSSNSSLLSRPTAKTTLTTVQGNPVPPLATFGSIEDSQDLFLSVLKKIVDLRCEGEAMDEIVPNVLNIPEPKRWGLFYYILYNYLHMAEVKCLHRKKLAEITEFLLKKNYISVEYIKKGCLEFSPIASDVCIDVPAAWQYILEYFGPLIHRKMLTVKDIWMDTLKSSNMGEKFLKHFILYCTKEIGPNFMRQVWRTQNLKWSDFIDEDKIESYIQQNKFKFVESADIPYVVTKEEDINTVLNRVRELLAENANKDAIIDYLSANIITVNKQFIRGLTTGLLNYSINKNNKLDEKRFSDICCPLLQRYIDSQPQMEMECLYAIQILINILEHPQGLLHEIFVHLYELEIINQDSLLSWRDSKEEHAGKGVAAKQLHTFFNKLLNENEVLSETSDENN